MATFVELVNGSAGLTDTTVSATMSGTPTDGDVIIAVLGVMDGPGGDDASGTIPAGPDASGATWTRIINLVPDENVSSGELIYVGAWWKIAASESTAVVQFSGFSGSGSDQSKKQVQVTRWNSITNPELAGVATHSLTEKSGAGPFGSANIASVTPTEDNGLSMGGAFHVGGTVPGTDFASTATYTDAGASAERSEGGTGQDLGSMAAYQTYSTAAAQSDTVTFAATDRTSACGFNVVIQPAAAGGTTPKGPLGMPFHGPFGGPV